MENKTPKIIPRRRPAGCARVTAFVVCQILEHQRENTASVARFRAGGDGVSRNPPPESRHNSAPGRARAGSSAESLADREAAGIPRHPYFSVGRQ